MKFKFILFSLTLILLISKNGTGQVVLKFDNSDQKIAVKGDCISRELMVDSMPDETTNKNSLSLKLLNENFCELTNDSLKYYELRRVYNYASWHIERGDTLEFRLKTWFIPLNKIDIKACETGNVDKTWTLVIYQTNLKKKEPMVDNQTYTQEGVEKSYGPFSFIYLFFDSQTERDAFFEKLKVAVKNAK